MACEEGNSIQLCVYEWQMTIGYQGMSFAVNSMARDQRAIQLWGWDLQRWWISLSFGNLYCTQAADAGAAVASCPAM